MSEPVSESMNYLKHSTLILFCIALIGCTISHKPTGWKGTSTEVLQLEQEVYQLINRYRISQNLPPLTTNEIITRQARMHSRAMATKRIPVGHSGFAKRVERISRSLPYRAAAENVAYNKGYSNCAQRATQDWFKNKGHRKNIEGNYYLTGIGVAMDSQGAYYFIQIFWQ